MRQYRQAGRTAGGAPALEGFGRGAFSEKFTWKRDYYAGGLVLLLGVEGPVWGTDFGYKFGSLARMGPNSCRSCLASSSPLSASSSQALRFGSDQPDDEKLYPTIRNGSAGSAFLRVPFFSSSLENLAG